MFQNIKNNENFYEYEFLNMSAIKKIKVLKETHSNPTYPDQQKTEPHIYWFYVYDIYFSDEKEEISGPFYTFNEAYNNCRDFIFKVNDNKQKLININKQR